MTCQALSFTQPDNQTDKTRQEISRWGHRWRGANPKDIPLSSFPPGFWTHVLLVRRKGALTKGLHSRLRLSESQLASLITPSQYLFGSVHGFGLEKYHLPWSKASESAVQVSLWMTCQALSFTQPDRQDKTRNITLGSPVKRSGPKGYSTKFFPAGVLNSCPSDQEEGCSNQRTS
jgi:hypothetical protein